MPTWIVHGISNVLLLAVVCYIYRKKMTRKELGMFSIVIIASNVIDIDHLLADPIYDPNRCSITTHPLHSVFAIPLYAAGLFFKNIYVRVFILSVLVHLALDAIACFI